MSAAGSDLGFSGLHATTQALARLGLLLLQDGVWDGRRLLPQGWVGTATSALADTSHHPGTADWTAGYGHQLWRSRHDGFRADGAYGQFALVPPGHDLVVAVTSCTEDHPGDPRRGLGRAAPGPRATHRGPADPAALARLSLALDSRPHCRPWVDHRPTMTPGPWVFTHAADRPSTRSLTGGGGAPRRHGWLLVVDDGGRLAIACGDGHWPDAGARPSSRPAGGPPRGLRGDRRRRDDPPLPALCDVLTARSRPRWRGSPLHGPGLARLQAPRD